MTKFNIYKALATPAGEDQSAGLRALPHSTRRGHGAGLAFAE